MKRIIIVILIQVFVNLTYDISGNPFKNISALYGLIRHIGVVGDTDQCAGLPFLSLWATVRVGQTQGLSPLIITCNCRRQTTPTMANITTNSTLSPSKHGAFTQCDFNAGPASKTVAQHWNHIGWMLRVCWKLCSVSVRKTKQYTTTYHQLTTIQNFRINIGELKLEILVLLKYL